MKKKTVYGKQKPARNILAEKLFTESSSPFKSPAKPPVTPPRSPSTPSRNTRSQTQRRQVEELERSVFLDENDEIANDKLDDLVKTFEGLGLKSEQSQTSSSANRSKDAAKQDFALAERDPNKVPQKASRRQKIRRKISGHQSDISFICQQLENSTCYPENEDHSEERATQKISANLIEKSTQPAAPRVGGGTDQDPPDQEKSSSQECTRSIILRHTKPLLELCNDPVGGNELTSFQAWSDVLAEFFAVTKIAEASYGEVYRLNLTSSQANISSSEESVIKIIPLKPPPLPVIDNNSSKPKRKLKKALFMSNVEDVLSEVRVLRHMSTIPGFTNFREIRVVQGRLPSQFVTAWKWYNKNVKKSLFPDPSRKASYDENQLWAVVEMQDAGTDVETLLDRGEKLSIWAAWDIFWGVACAVAKGEDFAGFEHRDLHIGNICVRSPNRDMSKCLEPKSSTVNLARSLGYSGLETTIIDYTLSRASMDDEDKDVAFFDLSKDPVIFEGDRKVDYQYEIYRTMRAAVLTGDPTARNAIDITGLKDGQRAPTATTSPKRTTHSTWRERHPLTNIVWLHFVLFKLIEKPLSNEDGAGCDRDHRLDLLALTLERRLEHLQHILAVENIASSGLNSAADLVGWAVAEGWLDEEDVIGLSAPTHAKSAKGSGPQKKKGRRKRPQK